MMQELLAGLIAASAAFWLGRKFYLQFRHRKSAGCDKCE
jgi:hypothetical protein